MRQLIPMTLLLLIFATQGLFGAIIPVGIISFNESTPGASNAFTISNLSGDPLLGGTALPPDFPVHTALTFTNATLELEINGVSQILNLGDIGPGDYVDSDLEFSQATDFQRATFQALITFFSVTLADGTAMPLQSQAVTGELVAAGAALLPGDLSILTITSTSEVPEPATLWLVGPTSLFLFSALTVLRKRR